MTKFLNKLSHGILLVARSNNPKFIGFFFGGGVIIDLEQLVNWMTIDRNRLQERQIKIENLEIIDH